MRKLGFFIGLSVLVLALTLAALVRLYPSLPDRFPTHFNLAGRPDHWGGKGSLWMVFGVQAGLSVLFLALIAAAPRLRRHPRWLNRPDRLERLPLEQQNAYWEASMEMLAAPALMINILFFTIQSGAIRISLGKAESLGRLVPAEFFLLFGALAYYILKLNRLSKPEHPGFPT